MQKVLLFSLAARGAESVAFDSFTLPGFGQMDMATHGMVETNLFGSMDMNPHFPDHTHKRSSLLQTADTTSFHPPHLWEHAERHGKSLVDMIHEKYGSAASRSFGRDFSNHFLSTLESQLSGQPEHHEHGVHHLLHSVGHAFDTAADMAHTSLKKTFSKEASESEDDTVGSDDHLVETKFTNKSF